MNDKLQAPAMLIGRILLAQIFILSGLSKLGAQDAIRGYMEAMHVSSALFWPTVLFEVVTGLLIAIGYRTRAVALVLAGFCVLTAVLFHAGSDPNQITQFLKNLSLAGGLVLLAAVGAGKLSADAKRAAA